MSATNQRRRFSQKESDKNRIVLEEFIQMYKNEPSLWKVNSRDYRNRGVKIAAYNRLAEKLREIDPTTDRYGVVIKINSLRSNFRKEVKKVQANPNYKPPLWYYNSLLFLCNADTPGNDCDEDDQYDDDDEILLFDEPEQLDLGLVKIEQQSSNFDTSEHVHVENSQNQQRIHYEPSTTVQAAIPPPTAATVEDSFDMLGRSVAMKLRALPRLQRLLAEKVINDVLFEAELGTLRRNGTSDLLQVELNKSGIHRS